MANPVKIIFYLLFVCLLIFILLAVFVFYGFYQIYIPLSEGAGDKIFEIEKGQSIEEIAGNLKKESLIRGDFWFKAYLWLSGKQDRIQAGLYLINSGLNISQIADVFFYGKTKTDEAWVTIPEGFTLKQIQARIEAAGLDVSGFEQAKIGDFEKKYNFFEGVPQESSLQGFLFPDTYKFKKDLASGEILTKMLNNFDEKLTEKMRQDIKAQNLSVFEIIIMASLLEKEVKTSSDRKIASGIFWKRLADGYPLESDATLSYIFEDKKDRHSAEETKTNSPYNTYRYAGLPPGPICNPGFEAIEAAIYPQESDYYFFLTKPEGGEAVFARTLQEHNANKAKYLK